VLLHHKALQATALDQHQAGLGSAQAGDGGQRARAMKNLLRQVVFVRGTAHLAALSEGDDAKRCTGLVAFGNHVKVACLKNLQRQVATRKQHSAQRKQGQGMKCKGVSHVAKPKNVGCSDHPTDGKCALPACHVTACDCVLRRAGDVLRPSGGSSSQAGCAGRCGNLEFAACPSHFFSSGAITCCVPSPPTSFASGR